MILSIEGFTHKGTLRSQNQDRCLVHHSIVSEGRFSMKASIPAHFFVADGVGGMPAGDIAADFVLSRIKEGLLPQCYADEEYLNILFHGINRELIEFSQNNPDFEGMATTLAGVIFSNNYYNVISAGDSQVFVFRNLKLKKLTNEPVFGEAGSNNPITSYFGGNISSLNTDISCGSDQTCTSDIFLIATDGIFKALTVGQIEKILSNSKSLMEKSEFMFYKAMQIGSPDNISCIFIHIN